jgi:hypothetical protein
MFSTVNSGLQMLAEITEVSLFLTMLELICVCKYILIKIKWIVVLQNGYIHRVSALLKD